MTFGVYPNPGVVVGALPVGVDVQDQGLIISNNTNDRIYIRYMFYKLDLDQNQDPASKMMKI
jgi:hypothetical protein